MRNTQTEALGGTSGETKLHRALSQARNSMKSLWLSTVVVTVISFLQKADPIWMHGTLVDPVSRNSLWRIDGAAPVNYNDIELFCGGIGVCSIVRGRSIAHPKSP